MAGGPRPGRADRCTRGRTGIGIELTHHRTAQAWACRHEQLREVLTRLVDGDDLEDLLR